MTALSESRVAAFNAKSIESLTVINRGSATTSDAVWAAAMKTATTALPSGNDDARRALSSYAEKHQAINKADVDGDWTEAKDQVISTGASSASTAFRSYATATGDALRAQATQAADDLDRSGTLLIPAAILLLLAGLGAAVGAWWGVSLRLDEYR